MCISKYDCACIVSTYSINWHGQTLARAIVHITARCPAQKGAYLVKDMRIEHGHSDFTVFPQNLAAARFYFKALFGAASIRGRLDFEGGVYRDRYAHAYTAPIISPLYARIMRVRIRIIVVDPLPCGEISRAAFIGMSWQKHAARF